MKAAVLRVQFYLHGCRSLKEKRRRLSGLRDKFGKQTSIAVCESGAADEHQRAQWSFVACAGTAAVVEQALAEVERYIVSSVDGEVVGMDQEWLI